MIELTVLRKKCADSPPADDYLELGYFFRRKSRQRVRLESGAEAAVLLPRGAMLKNGDVLESQHGFRVRVKAAPERVSSIQTENRRLLAIIAYHLGNRHVAVRIQNDRLSWLSDHILDDMVRHLGGEVTTSMVPFEPEEGAYFANSHHH